MGGCASTSLLPETEHRSLETEMLRLEVELLSHNSATSSFCPLPRVGKFGEAMFAYDACHS